MTRLKSLVLVLGLFWQTYVSSQVTTSTFGNWFTCERGGWYIEMITKDGFYRYSTSKGLLTPWEKLEVSGNTVFLHHDTETDNDLRRINRAIISLPSANEMILNFEDSKETWYFYKINDTVPTDNDEHLKTSTLKRAEFIKCPDLRSPAEMKVDSLPFVYFQF